MSRHNIVHTITGNKIAESDKAVKFRVHAISETELEFPKTEWFPLSQIEKMFTDPNNINQDTMVVSEWILKQKGML